MLAGLGALALMGAAGGGGGSSNVITKIQAFATDGTQAAPTVDDYKALAVTGVTDRNLGSINNAIDALSAADVDTKGKVQEVIDAYVKILAAANGPSPAASSANPTVDDYRAIGVNLGAVGTQPAAFSLFNDVVANLSTSSVDTVAKLGGLAAVVAKVMALADGGNATLTVDVLGDGRGRVGLRRGQWQQSGRRCRGDPGCGWARRCGHLRRVDGVDHRYCRTTGIIRATARRRCRRCPTTAGWASQA